MVNMVEPNNLDGFLDIVPVPDDRDDGPLELLDFLDLPMEDLEDDGEWDASNSHCLGPIPTDALLSLPPFPQDNILPLPPNASIGGTGETQESGSFHIHSPVSVLDSSGSCSGGKSLPIKPDVLIPVRSRSKRARPTNLNPWFMMPPISSARKMIRSRKNKEKKKKVSAPALVKIADESSQHTEDEYLSSFDSSEKKEGYQQHSVVAVKKCTHCEVTKTPQWREGPMGPKTLCNACGVRYRSGRLFPEYRPAASPTFVPALHSNSHKKVIEMRKKATMPETSYPDDVPVSPPAEFVPISSSLFELIY